MALIYHLIFFFVTKLHLTDSSIQADIVMTSFPNCTFLFVFLENKISETLEEFLQTVTIPEKNSILIESEPPWEIRSGQLKKHINSSELYPVRHTNTKFTTCYLVLYFQDALLESFQTANKSISSYLPSIISHSVIFFRNENPTAVIFITEEMKPNAEHYRDLHNVKITSTFLILTSQTSYLLCTICRETPFHEIFNWSAINSLWKTAHTKREKIQVTSWIGRQWEYKVDCTPYFHR